MPTESQTPAKEGWIAVNKGEAVLVEDQALADQYRSQGYILLATFGDGPSMDPTRITGWIYSIYPR